MTTTAGVRRWLPTLVSVLLLAVYLFPVYWMMATAVKPQTEIFAYPPSIVPSTFDLAVFRGIAADPRIMRYFLNSMVVGVGTTLLTLGMAAPAAYALAHLPIRGKGALQLLSLASLMFPAVMLATPLFVLFSRVGLLNSYPGLILANTSLALPFGIIVLRPYMLSIPGELAEAAQIDGCTPWTAFWRVVLPLARPGLFAAAVFTFLFGWSDLVFALSLTSSDQMRPVTAGLWNFIGANVTEWNSVMAFSTLAMLPPLVVFLFAQRHIVSGLTAGAVK